MSLWFLLQLAAAVYCFVRGSLDLRRRSLAWGIAGLGSGLILLMVPNPNNVVTVTLPVADSGR